MDEKVTLPAIIEIRSSALDRLTSAIGVSRDVLASDDEIARVWEQLPRLITQIPLEGRSALHARMCVAVHCGLFDSAVNYAWNSAIVALRDKVRLFGLHIVPQIIERDFDEKILLDLTDAELIQLCLSLNLISEDAYFFLDQCRDVRNNFSAAHPAIGTLDDAEFIVFLTRCAKYALSTTSNPKGVDTYALIESVKGPQHTAEQTQEWFDRIDATHEAQQELVINMLHGIYCDPSSSQDTRTNALTICTAFKPKLSPGTKSALINRHSDYIADGKTDRQELSQNFFENMGLLTLLSEQERHVLVSKGCRRLLAVHQEWFNFYNEPPFAERLLEISSQTPIPITVQAEFVTAIVTCAVGNRFGVSNVANLSYQKIIKNFSSREIMIMLDLPISNTIVGNRFKSFPVCQVRFKDLVKLLDPKQVPTSYASKYKSYGGS
jgi:hypothetical protein